MASLVSWELLIQSNFNPKLPVLQKFVITLYNLPNDEHFIRPKLLLICSKPFKACSVQFCNQTIHCKRTFSNGLHLNLKVKQSGGRWCTSTPTLIFPHLPSQSAPPPRASSKTGYTFFWSEDCDWWGGNMTLWTKWSIVEYWELRQKVDIYIVHSGKLLAAGLIFLISFFKFPAKVHMRWQGEWYRLTLIVVQWALKGMGGEKMKLSPVLSSNLD